MTKILLSSCLAGEKCAYDGKARTSCGILKLCGQIGFIDVCPEVLAGLGCPREKHEITGGDGRDVLAGKARVVSSRGKDRTENFIKGAEKTLELAIKHSVKIAVLKANSPSCGCGTIHSGDFDGKLREGTGVTAALLIKGGIKVFTEKEINALSKELLQQ